MCCEQDFCANYIGQELWLHALDWEHASEWRAAPAVVWEVAGERAGTVQAAEPLTYVKLDGAGHMVRLPAAAAAAAAAWLRRLCCVYAGMSFELVQGDAKRCCLSPGARSPALG